MSLLRGVIGASVVVTMVSACGGDKDDDADFNSGGTNAGTATTANINFTTGSGSGTSGGVNNVPVDGCAPPDEAGCVGQAYEGEGGGITDIYVMFDLSCSMSCNVDESGCCHANTTPPDDDWRIQPVREAMRTFLQDPASAGIGVGLGFFGDHDVNDNNNPDVCSVEAHSDSAVDIAPLPDAAGPLLAALDAGVPQGGTPTHLAIEGACNYAAGWKQNNQSHKVVILLVTDGIPEHSCNANIQQARQAADDCYDDGSGFQTYVLGVVANNNNSLDQLNEIAQAGGTNQAYLTNTDDVAGSVLEALNAIRSDAAIPCTLNLPPPEAGSTYDFDLVNLGICDSQGNNVETAYVPNADACGGAGTWYLEDAAGGPAIQLCDATCNTVGNTGSRLYFRVGCQRNDVVVE